MLLEPGNTTVPAALSSAGISRNSLANIRSRAVRSSFPGSAHAPARAGFTGLVDQVFQGLAVASLDRLLHGLERALEDLGLFEQFVPIGQQDVAPHLGLARGNAGEIAKT